MTEARLPPEADLVMLNALVDGELDAPTAAALERRIADEPELGKAHEAIIATRAALARLERPEVGTMLLDRIESAAGASGPTSPPRQPRWQVDWRALAASTVFTIVAAGSGGYWLGANRASETTSDLVASTHHRSLLAASPVDIASSDRHTVKPWLDNRIGISPPAPDLARPFPPIPCIRAHAGASARRQHRSLVRPCAFPFYLSNVRRRSRRPRKLRAYSGQALTLSRAVARRQVWPPGSVHAAVNRLAKSSPANLHAAL